MEERLKDRIAVITGGSSGIGRAIALLFARSGARVVVADLQSNGVEGEIANQYGSDRAKYVTCNVADEKQVVDLIRATVEWGGRLDVLCNVAGAVVEAKYNLQARCHDFDVEDFDKGMAVNAREVCVVGIPRTPAYTPAKHAVIGMTKQMALDYAEDRIHVNAVCPGYIKTPMADFKLQQPGGEKDLGGRHPWNAMGTADDCANAALVLASDDASFVSGNVLMVDGGFVAR